MTDPDDDRFDDWLSEHDVEPLFPRAGSFEHIARSARRRKVRNAAVTGAALAVVLAAVAGTAYQAFSNARPTPPAASASAAAPTTEPTAAPPSPTTSPEAGGTTATASPTHSATPVTRCHTGDVRVTVMGAPGGGAAGNVYNWLIFTNTSGRTCTLFGFPGVSYVTSASGQQVNDPAIRSTEAPSKVTLAPQQGAHAQLRTGHPETFPGTCNPVPVAGYRVYLPDETAAVFVPASMRQCSTNGVNPTTVSPVAPGTK
jgi:Protein of unknown function (DUF4232)